jgi:hypothetical protein
MVVIRAFYYLSNPSGYAHGLLKENLFKEESSLKRKNPDKLDIHI